MKADLTDENLKNEMTRGSIANNLRVIQIHPTLQCNLTCRHCYSSSTPLLKNRLRPESLISFLQYAREYKFQVLSVSGGEPFMYPDLEELLAASHALGNKNIAVSNGMLLKTDKAKRALSNLDILAVSIDGDEAVHDEMRNLKGAFRKMTEGINVLKDNGVNFGFIHTITEQSWQNLLWLSEFAFNNGAKLLQLHPLELTGRAALNFGHLVPSQQALHKTFILGNYLAYKYGSRMKVQMDFLHREIVLQFPENINFFGEDFIMDKNNFCDVVKCLVVDEHGDVFPMSYGFDKYFCLGNIHDVESGKDIINDFITVKGKQFYSLVNNTYSMIKNNIEDDLIIWTEMIVKESHHCLAEI